ncbi:hypothetical protein SAMN05216275_1416 [Streptosporangium canum]|uniref:Uncharacterized protein n=1 Tax=Streptosporangium canum TaxID=324952 RepID=A0A1I4DH58_9ACTN|nr:hypothetical protein [Streptosporangium canum]SFK91456.1 hypothetical protein SAMN05216275_1416 [Streptosporangium canum]
MAARLTINKRQLAERLGDDFKVSWVEDQCRKRRIPHLLIAGQYAFTEQHVAEILAMHERRPAEEQPAAAPAPAPTPALQRRTRASRPLPTIPSGTAPLRDRGLPTHRLRRDAS